MSTLLKTLNEQRGAKLKKAQEITAKLEAEKRGFTDDERAEIRGINDEVQKIDGDIEQEVRTISALSRKPLELNRKEEQEVRQFDLRKVLRSLMSPGTSALDGVEAEMVQEGVKEAREAFIDASGIMLPRMLCVPRENRDMSVTGGTTTQYGGALVQTNVGGLLGDFYLSSKLEAAGALVLNGLVGNLDLPVYTKGTDPVKKTENEAAGASGGTFASLALSPKRLPAYIPVSNQLIMQSPQALWAFISSELRSQMNGVKEKAFFHGTGTSEASGIAAKTGIGSVVGGTNGAAPTWAHIVALWKEIAVDDADAGSLAYFTNSAVVAKLLQTAKVASTDSRMIMEDLASMLLGFRVHSTNAISSTLTKGTAEGTASALFFGNANDYVVGYWGGVELEIVNDVTTAKAGQKVLVANTFYDGGVRRAKSFAAMLDLLPA